MNMPIQHSQAPTKEKAPMRTVAFNLLPANEQEDFAWWRRKAGRMPDEFLVRAEEEDPFPGSGQPVRREVIVKHVPSGKAMRYRAGPGSNWIMAFVDDLQAGYFRL